MTEKRERTFEFPTALFRSCAMLRQSLARHGVHKARKPSTAKAPRPVVAIPSKAKPISRQTTPNPTPSPFPLLHVQPSTSPMHSPSKFNHSSSFPPHTNPEKTSNPLGSARREPPLVEQARKKSVKQRSIWESYLVLDSRTRLLFSLGLGAVGLIGLYVGDMVQEEAVLDEVVSSIGSAEGR